jgi:hypothetical protein
VSEVCRHCNAPVDYERHEGTNCSICGKRLYSGIPVETGVTNLIVSTAWFGFPIWDPKCMVIPLLDG